MPAENKPTPPGQVPKKRISFLMPFIDFAFLLIILFVALLSVAYFDPSPTQALETAKGGEESDQQGNKDQKGTLPLATGVKTGGVEGTVFDPRKQLKITEDLGDRYQHKIQEIEEANKKIADLKKKLEEALKKAKNKGPYVIKPGRKVLRIQVPKDGGDAKEIERLKRAYEQAIREADKLKQELAGLNREVEDLRRRVQSLEAEKARLKKELAKAKKHNAMHVDLGSDN